MYCRSTNMCRTIQSLRSLLVGLFDHSGESCQNLPSSLPVILTRKTGTENMYPQADGRECPPLSALKAAANLPALVRARMPGHEAFEQRMRGLLGCADRVPWMHATDVLTCHQAHGISRVAGLTAADVQRVTRISSWIWGRWFSVRSRTMRYCRSADF